MGNLIFGASAEEHCKSEILFACLHGCFFKTTNREKCSKKENLAAHIGHLLLVSGLVLIIFRRNK